MLLSSGWAWCWRSKATKKKPRRCDNRARLARQQYRKYVERFLDFARNDRQRILDTGTTIDENLRSSPQDELAVASLRKFLCVVFRPAVAGLLECAQPARRVRASSRRFWGRRPLIEKRCEDASHSQSTSCKMPCRISTGVHVRSSKDRMVHLRLPIRQTILIDWPGAIDSAVRFPGSSYSRSLDHVQ